MKKKSTSQSAFFHLRVLFGLVLALAGVFLALLAFGAFSNAFAQTQGTKPASGAAQRQGSKTGSPATEEAFWASTGGPQGGDVLAMTTSTNGYVFAGTLGGGAFRSADNGEMWTPVNTGRRPLMFARWPAIPLETFLPELSAVSFDRRTMETPGRR
jgi:hypothetical protein